MNPLLVCWGGVMWTGAGEPLRKGDWEVRPVALNLAQELVRRHHYARGGSNTGIYTHGLFPRGAVWDRDCGGVTWWLPPTRAAAEKTFPERWQGVLSLSRLVILPWMPGNAATFLLAASRRLIDCQTWPCLVTYADTWRGHTGAIYLADGWEDCGSTKPSPVWTLDGRMIARKAGPKTRTHAEMIAMGCVLEGTFPKRKFRRIIKTR